MEQWLRSLLEWDPKKRGRNANGEVIVFSEVGSILQKKVRVYSIVIILLDKLFCFGSQTVANLKKKIFYLLCCENICLLISLYMYRSLNYSAW